MVSQTDVLRLVVDCLIRAYGESAANEGVVAFADPVGLAASVLAGNRSGTTWASPEYVQPTPAHVAEAAFMMKKAGFALPD